MGEEVLDLKSERRDSIELKMDSKGKYYWIIKVYFDNSAEESGDVVEEINNIDKAMREKFGNR